MHGNGKNAVDCGEKFTFHRVAHTTRDFRKKQRKPLAEYIMAELLQKYKAAAESRHGEK